MNNTNNNNNQKGFAPPETHHVRTFFAAIFGILALMLISFSIAVVWINQIVTNSNVYVSTVAPLATQPDVQNFIIQKVSGEIVKSIPTDQMAQALLPQSDLTSMSQTQLQSLLNSKINSGISKIVKSPSFAQLWKTTNQSASEQLISQLNSNSNNLQINLHPAVVGVVDQLGSTDLSPIAKNVTVSPTSGVLNIKSSKVSTVHRYYRDFKNSTLALIAATIICFALCIWLSVHHMKTLRRMLIGTGIISLIFAFLLKIPSFLINTAASSVQQKATFALISTLFNGLYESCLILGIACIIIAIGSKVQEKYMSQKKA